MKHSPEFLRLVKSVKRRIREVSVEEVRKRFSHKASFHFIDVREDHEWAKGHAKGAIHMGRGILERDVEETIPNNKAEIVLYCGGGFRSALSAENLQKMGYKNVFSMAGGFRAWAENGGAVLASSRHMVVKQPLNRTPSLAREIKQARFRSLAAGVAKR